MNRDKTIIAVLAVLLLASVVINGWLWRRLRSVNPATAANTALPAARAEGERERGKSAEYEIVVNPKMQGRLGRIVLRFAGEPAALGSTRTAIYKPGSATVLKTHYGPFEAELLAGEYDLDVSGRKIAGIPVEPGKDTVIASGVLRLHGSSSTRFVIYPVGEPEKYLYVDYGNGTRGLPIGEYEVEVSGQREKVVVEAGKVTDF